MLYSTYRPAVATDAEPARYDRSYSDEFHRQHPPQPHDPSSYASASSPTASTSSMAASCDRFEYKSHALIASILERRLADNDLVRDCSVIGVPQLGGVTITSPPSQMSQAGTVPIAFVALSTLGRERSALGGEKESKRMKIELTKWLVDFAPAFRQMKGKLMFVESIPRGPAGTVLRHLLVEKATSPPAPGPDKGFFNTVLSESINANPHKETNFNADDACETASPPKKTVRDSKRRATHSQIERRRREKINDRLVTLRSIVPACAKELEDRRRQKQEEEDEAARVAAGGAPKTYIDAVTGKPKRKRNRKKPDSKKAVAGADKEEELGLHKLEVLTHAINYIFELKAHIHKLETGSLPDHVPTADNPFGVRNKDGSYRRDAKFEDEPGCGVKAHLVRSQSVQLRAEPTHNSVIDQDENGREGEEDQLEDDAVEQDDEGDEEEEDDDEPLERRSKKHMSSTTSRPSSVAKSDIFSIPNHYRGTDTTYSSSSSRGSAEISPAFSLIQQSPNAISPATTITSPMMSLSAESPILLPDPAINLSKGGSSAPRVSQSPAFPTFSTSTLPLPPSQQSARRESSSFLFKQLSLTSPNFAPFNPPNHPFPATTSAAVVGTNGNARPRIATLSFPAYGEDSEVRQTSTVSGGGKLKTPGLSDRDKSASSDATAAELLLNFSTSPEVLRPIGSRHSVATVAQCTASVASSPHTRPVIGLPSHRSRSTFSSPQYRPVVVPLHTPSYPSARVSIGTAPGQEVASTNHGMIEEPEPLNLASPPHLALDSSPDGGLDIEQGEDHSSEKTVEEPTPVKPVKLDDYGKERQTVEMDTGA